MYHIVVKQVRTGEYKSFETFTKVEKGMIIKWSEDEEMTDGIAQWEVIDVYKVR